MFKVRVSLESKVEAPNQNIENFNRQFQLGKGEGEAVEWGWDQEMGDKFSEEVLPILLPIIAGSSFFLVDFFVQPHGHELGARKSFSAGDALRHGKIKRVHTEGDRLPGGAVGFENY